MYIIFVILAYFWDKFGNKYENNEIFAFASKKISTLYKNTETLDLGHENAPSGNPDFRTCVEDGLVGDGGVLKLDVEDRLHDHLVSDLEVKVPEGLPTKVGVRYQKFGAFEGAFYIGIIFLIFYVHSKHFLFD
jgi:hypothetical protein